MSNSAAAKLIVNDIMQMIGSRDHRPYNISRIAFMVKGPNDTETSPGGLCKESLIGRIVNALDRHGIIIIK
jgi:hypothetical protein